MEVVKPSLISYDHYQLAINGDTPHYFLNLDLIRQAAQGANVPFLNIVQACTWTPSMRVPTGDELRYLLYTTLAYGGQGISYYVYCHPGHEGGLAKADGTPTPLYDALKVLNREFVAIATQLQPLRFLGAFHAGMTPPGTEPLPADTVFTLDPPVPPISYKPPERVRGVLLGLFGPANARQPAQATHAVIVNLDYRTNLTAGVKSAHKIQVFEPATGQWSPPGGARLELSLPSGGGRLVRLQQ